MINNQNSLKRNWAKKFKLFSSVISNQDEKRVHVKENDFSFDFIHPYVFGKCEIA